MNRILAYIVTWAIFILVFFGVVEAGLRLIGMGPQPTINQFHSKVGWVKSMDTTACRATSEFNVTYSINALGLRDDENLTKEKPEGKKRILFLGDSFTLGYTVDRKDLFVDLLEKKLNEENRNVEIINAGTEGYSTDQELIWFREEGLSFHPDMVVLNFYQNDVFWNSQDHYQRFPKPLFSGDGPALEPVNLPLKDPGEQGWFAGSTAVGKFLSGVGEPIPTFKTATGKTLFKEMGVVLKDEPDFIAKSWRITRAILAGFKATCEARKIDLIVALIPTKAEIYSEFKEIQQKELGLSDDAWDPHLPLVKMKALCRELGIDYYDPSAPGQVFMTEAAKEVPLYYTIDRHLSPAGNRAFAQGLYYHLAGDPYLGKINMAITPIAMSEKETSGEAAGVPGWLITVLILWFVLGIMYASSYRDENSFLAFLKVGGLIWVVVGLIAVINLLVASLPHGSGGLIVGIIALCFFLFLFWKLRKRLSLIMELYLDFTNRGHWYMMPLLAVMLAIGSLLIVAASSPFVAPFIYTLF
ncbi:MAG: DUF5989 family protein [Planctomycetota bacterium]